MSTINVDNIAEYTSSGKINATHDIKLASGKNILDSSGNAIGGMVKLASETVSSATASVIFDDFVDNSKYSLYKIFTHHILPVTDNNNFWAVFRSGGASGSDITGTYRRAGTARYPDTSGSTVFGNQSSANYAPIVPGNGANADESLIIDMTYRVCDGTNGINSIQSDTAYQLADDTVRNQVVIHILEQTIAATGIKFQMNTGNIASGTITIYGVLL